MEYSSGNDTDYVLNAINPMPSAVADLGGIDLMRLNAYTPLNAVGDLIRAGLFFGMSYYFVVGIFFASLEANLRFESGPTILRVGQLGLVFVFALETLQYPLRNVTRLLYYSLAIGLAMRLFTLLKAKRSKRVKSRADGGALPGKWFRRFGRFALRELIICLQPSWAIGNNLSSEIDKFNDLKIQIDEELRRVGVGTSGYQPLSGNHSPSLSSLVGDKPLRRLAHRQCRSCLSYAD